jgi:Holliday junction resolvase RusA-like endonuclease
MRIAFTVPGRVVGKGRPRFVRQGSFVRTYTPAPTLNCEAMVRTFAHEAMTGQQLLIGPVSLTVTIYLIPPQSWSRRKRLIARFPTGKPDLDNCQKLLCDAMNGIVFTDDSQIADAHVRRLFDLNSPERVEVVVEEMIERRTLFPEDSSTGELFDTHSIPQELNP